MERTTDQTWTELKTALEDFITLQDSPTATMQSIAAARHKVEILERELTGLNAKKAA